MKSLFTIFLFAFFALCTVHGHSNEQHDFSIVDEDLIDDSLPVEVTDESFDKLVNPINGTSKWFIKFFAPWCGHCKRLRPTWDKLSEELKPLKVNMATVDCTSGGSMTCERFDIEGYPTVVFLESGRFYRFKGRRDAETLKAFAL